MGSLQAFLLVSVFSAGFIWMSVEALQRLRGYSGHWTSKFQSAVMYWLTTILLGGFFSVLTFAAARENYFLVNHFISNSISFAIGFILYRLSIWRKQDYCKLP
ncbi:MAG TPA: hypothetical protein PKD79_00195 [Candidatus Doudnabacteria bacterium]|nr:hypothetical protein [Candidatus Doudnabacteria bacterium]